MRLTERQAAALAYADEYGGIWGGHNIDRHGAVRYFNGRLLAALARRGLLVVDAYSPDTGAPHYVRSSGG